MITITNRTNTNLLFILPTQGTIALKANESTSIKSVSILEDVPMLKKLVDKYRIKVTTDNKNTYTRLSSELRIHYIEPTVEPETPVVTEEHPKRRRRRSYEVEETTEPTESAESTETNTEVETPTEE